MVPHIAWVFPGFAVGGAQMRFVTLANAWGPVARHSIISLNGQTGAAAALRPDLAFQLVESAAGKRAFPAAVLAARHQLRRLAPDTVVTSNWGAIEWAAGARLAGLRHVHTEDGFGPEEQAGQIRRRVLTRRVVLRGSQIVLPSRTLLAIARNIWRLPACRLHYIPNGIEAGRIYEAAPMPAPPGEGPVIGTVAVLRREKALDRLIDGFALFAQTQPGRLVIVGDGPERAALEARAEKSGFASRIHFAGHSPSPARWMKTFDVFALSSNTEQMPLSLLEAMAAGLPAVCTRVGDVAEMLSEENQRFVVPLEAAALAEGLAALLRTDHQAIRAANRAKVMRDYAESAMIRAHAALLGVA